MLSNTMDEHLRKKQAMADILPALMQVGRPFACGNGWTTVDFLPYSFRGHWSNGLESGRRAKLKSRHSTMPSRIASQQSTGNFLTCTNTGLGLSRFAKGGRLRISLKRKVMAHFIVQ